MSMIGGRVPQGRDEVGQTVASFPTYEAAQKAVSTLIAAEIPARDIAIVGQGPALDRAGDRPARLRRRGPLRAPSTACSSGLLFSAILVIGSPVGADPGVRRRAVRRHRDRHAAEHRHLLVRAPPPGLRLGHAGRRRPLRGDGRGRRASSARARCSAGRRRRRATARPAAAAAPARAPTRMPLPSRPATASGSPPTPTEPTSPRASRRADGGCAGEPPRRARTTTTPPTQPKP